MPGGGERYVGALARGLVASGQRVTVVTGAAVRESQFWEGAPVGIEAREERLTLLRLPIRRFPGGRRGLMLYRKAMVLLSAAPGNHVGALMALARRVPSIVGFDDILPELIHKASPDVIHAFNVSWEAALVAAYSAACGTAWPLVVTPFAHLGAGFDDRVARNSTMQHQRQIMRDAARVLVLTDVERYGLAVYGVPAEKIAVIGGGVDPLPDDFTFSPFWPAAGRPWPEPYAVFVGRLSYDKGAIHAARAILRLPGRAIALIGSATPEFERFYAGLSADERARVRPLGLLSEADKHAVVARAGCLLLPSRSDSFGIVLLEAWAHGRPVVAARAGGIPGVVDDGVNGLLVPFGDVAALETATERLLSDGNYAGQLGENGRRKVGQEYNWDAVTERVLSHYRAIVRS